MPWSAGTAASAVGAGRVRLADGSGSDGRSCADRGEPLAASAASAPVGMPSRALRASELELVLPAEALEPMAELGSSFGAAASVAEASAPARGASATFGSDSAEPFAFRPGALPSRRGRPSFVVFGGFGTLGRLSRLPLSPRGAPPFSAGACFCGTAPRLRLPPSASGLPSLERCSLWLLLLSERRAGALAHVPAPEDGAAPASEEATVRPARPLPRSDGPPRPPPAPRPSLTITSGQSDSARESGSMTAKRARSLVATLKKHRVLVLLAAGRIGPAMSSALAHHQIDVPAARARRSRHCEVCAFSRQDQ